MSVINDDNAWVGTIGLPYYFKYIFICQTHAMPEVHPSGASIKLGNKDDWELRVNEDRVLLRSKKKEKHQTRTTPKWTVLSSAVLNGGLCTFDDDVLQILNTKVPVDYDGIHPNPVELLKKLANQEEDEEQAGSSSTAAPTTTATVGLMTAASMKTLRVATQQASSNRSASVSSSKTHFKVDAIVTAGISNSRTVGADADAFDLPTIPSRAGTINIILLTNASFTPAALVEAYMLAIEAKCKACMELGIVCAKTGELAQGTGTDSTALVTPSYYDTSDDNNKENINTNNKTASLIIPYAGKHTLVGELIGRAVYQATYEALWTNLQYAYHGSPTIYRLYCHKLQILRALQQGHLPLVPSQPMSATVPEPRGWVLFLGLAGVGLAFGVHILLLLRVHDNPQLLPHTYDDVSVHSIFFPSSSNVTWARPPPSISVLLAVAVWDRMLGSFLQPVSLHPVVLVGNLITRILSMTPEQCFDMHHPVLGFVAGCVLWLTTVGISLMVSWYMLTFVPIIITKTAIAAAGFAMGSTQLSTDWIWWLQTFVSWFLQVRLLSGSLNLQLLLNVGLQMAHFLERGQIQSARDQLSWLCSRDASTLQSDDLSAATLESLSENLSDSLVSPLVWYVLLGPLGAFGFKVINTLDSRVGYRGGRFEWAGKPSARIDDVANLVSARLTALLLMLAVVFLSSGDTSTAIHGGKIAWTNAGLCESPNAGWPMATMSGLLHVCLEKKGAYRLNAGARAPGYADIRAGHSIALLAGVLAVGLAMLVIACAP